MRPAMRCVHCRRPWTGEPGTSALAPCAGCGAPIRVDAVAVDFVAGGAPTPSTGARVMQSRPVARVYEGLWRPILFGLSTAFSAPGAKEEAREVLQLIEGCADPWLDVSCGPGTLLREIMTVNASRDGTSPASPERGRNLDGTSPASPERGRSLDGTSPASPERGRNLKVFGLDRSRAMLERARLSAPLATLVRADAADLPFEDATFGAIANLAALDLYPHPARVVAEAARVLAPGGRWVCSTFVRRAGRDGGRPPRTPSIDEVADWARRAGLVRFGRHLFRRYAIAWADKG
jgi:SAM-dependent methyltransferase